MEMKPKAVAVCRAVLKLLDGGADINSLKVSEIAQKAGIGKGTVYDYFSSKEDMVIHAVMYELDGLLEEMRAALGEDDGFEKKIFWIFGCIERYSADTLCMTRFIRLVSQNYEMGNNLRKELEEHAEKMQGPFYILKELYQEGKKEGLYRGELPASLAVLALSMRFVMYMMYMNNWQNIREYPGESIKLFLYQGILEDLNRQVN